MEKSQKMSFWQVVKRFFEPVIEKPKRAIVSTFLSLIYAGLSIFIIVCLRDIANILEIGNQGVPIFSFIVLGLCFLFLILIQFFSKIVSDKLLVDVANILDGNYFRRMINLDNTFVERQGTGRISSILRKGVIFWFDTVVEICGSYMITLITVLGSVIVLISKGFSFVRLGIGVVLCIFWIVVFHKYSYPYRKKAKALATEMDRSVVRLVMSKIEILQSGKIEEEIAKRISLNNERMYTKHKEKARQGLCYDGGTLILYFGLLVIIVFTSNMIMLGKSSMADFVLVIGLGLQVVKQLSDIGNIAKKIFDESIHLEQLRQVFDDGPKIAGINIGSNFTYKSGNIKIHNMSFGYDKSSVFQNFSLQIQGGTKTAFVGESGGGKTTLIKLLAGYIRPDKGEIEIDGQKLSEIKLTDYYKHIGYLTQDPSVFDGTIYENLVYGLPDDVGTVQQTVHQKIQQTVHKNNTNENGQIIDLSLQDRIKSVISLAKCEFIREFEKGLETEIGERGVRLSGGQKQRLAIAKIMLKNPNIILLDEPTSALDSFNEEQISIALHNLFKGKTVIVVAHRLQTVKQADRILLFEQGKILEEGTHDELVKLGGKYKKMLDLQSGF